ncbi:MAG: hypothetical protein L7F77_09230 [Candidatus Magnetominusculus sp. LBB02]|nr:hypothetical protein [Candidatus Magnetominusculus sp. LBB02]
MYSDKFERSIKFVLQAEGGYVNDPHDPGGETKYGISKRMHKDVDIKNLTVEEAKAIYYKDYWTYMKCEDIEWPICLAHFDAAVNCGFGGARKWLAESNNDANEYLKQRETYYRARPQMLREKFLKGWLNRLNHLRDYIEREA